LNARLLLPSALSLLTLTAAAWAWAPPLTDPRWPLQLFDHPCADIALGNAEYQVHCAADGSTAALQGPVDAGFAHNLRARQAWDARGTARWGQLPAIVVSVQGDLVIVENTTCPACARVMGMAWVLRPERAPDALLRTVQQTAGLPTEPLLRTVRAWRSAARRR